MLEFRPKARKKDVEAFIESCRTKFGCFETGNSEQDLAGFPEPIQESIQVYTAIHTGLIWCECISMLEEDTSLYMVVV